MAETTNEQVTTEQAEQPQTTPPATGTDPAKNAEPETTFTQADVERLIKERLERERKAAREKYADYDDLKAAKAKLQEIEDANKTEAEKATEKLAEYERKLQEQADENARLARERLETLQRMEVQAEAGRQGFDPKYLDAAWKLIDKSALGVDDDGKPTGIEEAVKGVAETYPDLLKATPKLAPTNPGRGGQVGQTDDDRRERMFGTRGVPFGNMGGGARHFE